MSQLISKNEISDGCVGSTSTECRQRNAVDEDDGQSCNNIIHSETCAESRLERHLHQLHLEGNKHKENKQLLSVAFVTFFSFTIIQLVYAFYAKSQSMKGDSFAMLVDSVTYLFNYFAEKVKHRMYEADTAEAVEKKTPGKVEAEVGCTDDVGNESSPNDIQREENDMEDQETLPTDESPIEKEWRRRKHVLLFEILPPTISLASLIVITIFIIVKASRTLQNPTPKDGPNLTIMMTFSSINLALDILNVCCFAKARHCLGYKTVTRLQDDDDDVEEGKDDDLQDHMHKTTTKGAIGFITHNLNMCSAYTHIMADTLRSIAVIVATILVLVIKPPNVTGEQADSVAALVVSAIILVSLVPLVRGLCMSTIEYRAICKLQKNGTK
jgi:Co/Zn/Cd efflux system component